MRTINLKCLDTILQPNFRSIHRVHLVVLNSASTSKHLPQLLRIARSVYCADGGANRILPPLEKGDAKLAEGGARWIVGDLDSAAPAAVEKLKSAFGFQVDHRVDLNTTDFQKTLHHLIVEHGMNWTSEEVLVVEGASGGRFDQTFAALAEGFKRNFDPALMIYFGDETACCVIPAGENQILLPSVRFTGAGDAMIGRPQRSAASSEHAVITDVVGLLPLLPCKNVSTEGFTWNLKNSPMRVDGLISSSNGLPTGTRCVKVASDEQILFYMQLN